MRQGVKSPAVVCLAAFALGVLGPSEAWAQHVQDRGPLIGGGAAEPKAPVETDPWLPTGPPLPATVERPSARPACSFDGKVCVHPGPDVSDATAAGALDALSRAYTGLVEVLGLPAPLPDAGRGGGDGLDLYLRSDGAVKLTTEHDPPDLTRFDRASAFCVLDGANDAPLQREATLCVAEAIAWTLDAGMAPPLRRAYAAHLWHIVGAPTYLDFEAIDDAQSHPELGLVEGSGLLFDLLDERRGRSQPGFLATALLSAAANKTAPGAWQWDNEPDVFDVLRHTLADNPRKMAEAMNDLAVARGFVGSRGDGTQIPSLSWSGDFGRVRFDWVLPLSSLPRRVASQHALLPTGSIYVWLDLDQPVQGETLAFQAEWEPPVSFQWTLVQVDAAGRELSRIDAPYQQRATKVEQQIVNLEGAAGVMVVGINLGGVDLKHPFDPDIVPPEPHECTVYLTKL